MGTPPVGSLRAELSPPGRGLRRRSGAAAVAAILRTGPPSGAPPATLRPVLGKRRGLPATRPACLVQLPFQALDLLLQALILPLRAVVLALQPLGVAIATAFRSLRSEMRLFREHVDNRIDAGSGSGPKPAASRSSGSTSVTRRR